MPERENRREQILEVAAELFGEHGYQATSVRQIAQTVGCSEAALYYHFKDGKRELLREVLATAMPDSEVPLEHLNRSTSLSDLMVRYGQGIASIRGGSMHQMLRWLVGEVPHLTPEERALLYAPLLRFQKAIGTAVERFVSDPAQANEIAWLLLCTSFGYRQIFLDLQVETLVQQDVTRLFALIAGSVRPE